MLGRLAMDAPTRNMASAVVLASWLVLGAAAGTGHFVLLRWNTGLYLASSGILRAAAVHLLRMTVTATALAFAAWHGTDALLSAGLGVLLARMVVLRVMAVTP